ncbi:restriction endonuclease [Sphingobacterium sp. MYb388]|uniref:restriction endonuclease n=1 Tax=Sphingobacterium sp. MYb388 TaxID=2745437 RepID=UPI0030ABAD80
MKALPLPKHDELRVPIMELLNTKGTMKLRDFVEPLAGHYKLSDDAVNEMYPSGNGHIFYDRISWALSYLNMGGLLDKPKRGVYNINEKGKDLLLTPELIDSYIDNELKKREPVRSKNKSDFTSNIKEQSLSNNTPQEELYASFESIKESIFDEILETILSKTPAAFEQLVLQLLQKMGYGGAIKNSGFLTKYSNDGGIDGIIKEDILGFGRIHLQAKRYKTDSIIGREDIQKFVGALAVAQSNKGVFITTSSFSKGAIDYANSLNGSTTIILINGKQLASYIYEYSLGMQVEQTIEIKKLDADYWDSMIDE